MRPSMANAQTRTRTFGQADRLADEILSTDMHESVPFTEAEYNDARKGAAFHTSSLKGTVYNRTTGVNDEYSDDSDDDDRKEEAMIS